jgi:hypothetical protein
MGRRMLTDVTRYVREMEIYERLNTLPHGEDALLLLFLPEPKQTPGMGPSENTD